jgi:hypothetical protein
MMIYYCLDWRMMMLLEETINDDDDVRITKQKDEEKTIVIPFSYTTEYGHSQTNKIDDVYGSVYIIGFINL